MYLLYNFVKKCPNNSQNEYKYTVIFGPQNKERPEGYLGSVPLMFVSSSEL